MSEVLSDYHLLQNSQPRIPNPSIVESKLRSVEKAPVLLPKVGEVRAVINNDFTDDGKRLVLLTKTSQRLSPMAITAAGDKTEPAIQVDDVPPRVMQGAYPHAVIKSNYSDAFTASGIGSDCVQNAQDSSIDLEPECILGMEEKIVPDVDDDDHEEVAQGARVAVAAEPVIPDDDIKPCIKEEILDEYPAAISPIHSDIDLPCADEDFVISRQQIIELMKFCSQCGSPVGNRYYSDRSGALGVALICTAGHTVELSLSKQSTAKPPPKTLANSVISNRFNL